MNAPAEQGPMTIPELSREITRQSELCVSAGLVSDASQFLQDFQNPESVHRAVDEETDPAKKAKLQQYLDVLTTLYQHSQRLAAKQEVAPDDIRDGQFVDDGDMPLGVTEVPAPAPAPSVEATSSEQVGAPPSPAATAVVGARAVDPVEPSPDEVEAQVPLDADFERHLDILLLQLGRTPVVDLPGAEVAAADYTSVFPSSERQKYLALRVLAPLMLRAGITSLRLIPGHFDPFSSKVTDLNPGNEIDEAAIRRLILRGK